MCLCFTGHLLALHRTQVPDRLALAAALPLSARTPATLPSIALSVAAALGIQVCLFLAVQNQEMLKVMLLILNPFRSDADCSHFHKEIPHRGHDEGAPKSRFTYVATRTCRRFAC